MQAEDAWLRLGRNFFDWINGGFASQKQCYGRGGDLADDATMRTMRTVRTQNYLNFLAPSHEVAGYKDCVHVVGRDLFAEVRA
jgi:hypothetical protein